MGDRTGLPKLDRTNGFDDGRDYMRVKKSKLAEQNEKIRDALRSRNSSIRTDIFKDISINVNGRTQPTADELKRLILLNGGEYHPYYRYQTTKFMIATNLSTARIKNLRPDDRIVRPEWITDSIKVKCLLPYQDYQLFIDEPRGKTGSVLELEPNATASNSNPNPNSNSSSSTYNKSYRNSKRQKSEPKKEVTKSRDIREMFSRIVRSIDQTNDKKMTSSPSNSQPTSELLKGISISVHGQTQPSDEELKRIVLKNGGEYHPYYIYQTTEFMIASNLSNVQMGNLRPGARIVRPEWITDSVAVECLLPYEDYLLFVKPNDCP